MMIVLVHGGPGACGDLAPLKALLNFPTVESIQKGFTIEEQIEELHKDVTSPSILIGHSWGALLSILFAEKYPHLVKKLILIGCPSFEQADDIMDKRFQRLSPAEVERLKFCMTDLSNHFEEAAKLISKADSYDLLPQDTPFYGNYETFKHIQPKIKEMRESGLLLKALEKLACPITVIQGEVDNHIVKPLEKMHLIMMPKCGHMPWLEKEARDPFLTILEKECFRRL